MCPVTVLAVSGSTLKYTGAGTVCAAFGGSVLSFPEQPARRAAAQQRVRKGFGFMFRSLDYSFPGGPAFLGIWPVRDSRNATRSARSSAERWSDLMSLSR